MLLDEICSRSWVSHDPIGAFLLRTELVLSYVGLYQVQYEVSDLKGSFFDVPLVVFPEVFLVLRGSDERDFSCLLNCA